MSEQRAYAPLPPAPPSGYAPLPQAPSPIDHALALGGAASLPQSNVGASLASPQISPVDALIPTASPAAAAQAPPQVADPLGFAYNVIGKGETGNDPDAAHRLYGARPGYFGFPDWQGAQGPAGPTHAAGAVQWEPDTWKQAATAYVNAGNPTPDFNKAEDQEKVFRFWAPLEYAKATRGRNLAQDVAAGVDWKTPLAATWPSLIPHSLHNPTRPDLNGLIASAQQAGDERHQINQASLAQIQSDMDHYRQIAESSPAGSKEMDEALARQTELSERAAKTFDEIAAHPPVYTPKDVMTRLGSLATVIAVLGGLKSRQPLTAALGAAGQAMKALNQNNYDNYKIAYDQWKAQSDLVVQSLRAHSEAINQILSNKRLSQEEKNSELNALATVTGNDFLKAKLATDDAMAPYTIQRDIFGAQTELQKNALELERMNQTIQSSVARESEVLLDPTKLDASGNPTAYLFNKVTHQATTLAGQPYTPGGAQKVGTSSQSPPNPENVGSVAKLIADYNLPPLSGWAMRTPYGQSVMAEVSHINPQYDAKQYQAQQRAITNVTSGKAGDVVRSFSVSLDHLQVAMDIFDGLKNGDNQLLNAARLRLQTMFGSPLPPSLETAQDIVADEVHKAILGGIGGVTEREEMQRHFSAASSPAQFHSVAQTAERLIAGQLRGYERQYKGVLTPEQFSEKLSPEARELYRNLSMNTDNGQSVPVPASHANDPDGTTYNNGTWIKRGNRMIQVK